MYHIKIIKYLYIGLTVLTIICPVNIPFWNFLPGLILMWLIYIFYYAGIKRKEIDFSGYKDILILNKRNRLAFTVAMIYLIFYPLYIKFYTGLNTSTALSNVLSGVSNYSIYQSHFNKTNLTQFSYTKLPFIIGHGVLRFLFIAIVFRNLIYKNKPSFYEILSIVIMVITIIIVGLARGTSYEFFELFLIFFFAIVSKRVFTQRGKLITRKMILKTTIITIIILIFFTYNIKVRMGGTFSYSNSPLFDKHSIVYFISKPIALLIFPFYDYFLFGLQFISIVTTHLWVSSVNGFIALLIPHGIKTMGLGRGYQDFVGNFISLGSRWTPDLIVLINYCGIVLSLVFIYFLGRFTRTLYNEIGTNLQAAILLFYSCYIMFSLPIGNFITASSANIITIVVALIFYRIKFLNRYLFNI